MAENECPFSRRESASSSSWVPESRGARRGGRSLSGRGPRCREEAFLLGSSDLNCLRALLPLLNLELHPLTFVKGAIPRYLNL